MAEQKAGLNLDELKELIRVLRESNVTEFEFRNADYRLRIRQGQIVENGSGSAMSAASNGAEAAPVSPAFSVEAPPVVVETGPKETYHEVRSPIVGTFYRSSSPGSSAFVEVGDQVRKNQVLCIVEAMKIMNEIESDVEGEIRAIHVSNGQPVEFGELLFSIKPI
jgi:acetyl-CoA carboxylase biotin carboxyl carrier protein